MQSKSRLIAFVLITALLCGCMDNETTTTTLQTTTTLVPECVLSMCDCKCHPKGTTREETEGVLCGINCLGEYKVAGCEYKDNACTEIKVEDTGVGIANPASVKCIQDNGVLKIINSPEGQRGLCLFPDGSVCEEWAHFRGECSQGECMKKCDNIGTRSEGWYDCNGELLYWETCSRITGEFKECAGFQKGGICTMQYDPVCAKIQFDGGVFWATYGSACSACSDDQVNVLGYMSGECPTG